MPSIAPMAISPWSSSSLLKFFPNCFIAAVNISMLAAIRTIPNPLPFILTPFTIFIKPAIASNNAPTASKPCPSSSNFIWPNIFIGAANKRTATAIPKRFLLTALNPAAEPLLTFFAKIANARTIPSNAPTPRRPFPTPARSIDPIIFNAIAKIRMAVASLISIEDTFRNCLAPLREFVTSFNAATKPTMRPIVVANPSNAEVSLAPSIKESTTRAPANIAIEIAMLLIASAFTFIWKLARVSARVSKTPPMLFTPSFIAEIRSENDLIGDDKLFTNLEIPIIIEVRIPVLRISPSRPKSVFENTLLIFSNAFVKAL